MERRGKYLDCPICGVTFYRKRCEIRTINYCSYRCSGFAAMKRGNIKPTPKGVRRAPITEFKPGQVPYNYVPVGTVRHRTHKGDDPRAWVKVAEPNVWRMRAMVVWEQANGPIPARSIIHHINRDKLDDSLGNLECLSRADHLAEHRAEIHQATTSRNMPMRSTDSAALAS